MYKIIYSLKVMLQLVELGHNPTETMPNPKYPRFNCWIFKVDDAFQHDLDKVLGGEKCGG